MKINISTIIEAIEMADDNFTFFLDLETGKAVSDYDFLSDKYYHDSVSICHSG